MHKKAKAGAAQLPDCTPERGIKTLTSQNNVQRTRERQARCQLRPARETGHCCLQRPAAVAKPRAAIVASPNARRRLLLPLPLSSWLGRRRDEHGCDAASLAPVYVADRPALRQLTRTDATIPHVSGSRHDAPGQERYGQECQTRARRMLNMRHKGKEYAQHALLHRDSMARGMLTTRKRFNIRARGMLNTGKRFKGKRFKAERFKGKRPVCVAAWETY